MANATLDYTSLVSGTGWTNPTNVATSDNTRATDGDATEFINIEIDNAPGDYNDTNTGNTVTLSVEARHNNAAGRDKTITMDLLDSGNNAILDSGSNPITFTTANLTNTDATYTSGTFTLADNYTATNVNGWRLRATVVEGGGMPGSRKAQIDYMSVDLQYDAVVVPITVSAADGTEQTDAATADLTVPGSASDGVEATDAATVRIDYAVSATDGVEVTDTPSERIDMSVAAADGVDAGDSLVGSLLVTVGASDGVDAGDSAVGALTVPASVVDGVDAGDSGVAVLLVPVTAADGVDSGDSATATVDSPPAGPGFSTLRIRFS